MCYVNPSLASLGPLRNCSLVATKTVGDVCTALFACDSCEVIVAYVHVCSLSSNVNRVLGYICTYMHSGISLLVAICCGCPTAVALSNALFF
jgi:hypothetical protein